MPYAAKILADSISPAGARLTTMEITYPRFVHSEFMTHRLFSRNAASSRAIPIEKMIERVEKDPAMPVWWGKNQKGMQAAEELTGRDREVAEFLWCEARDRAVSTVFAMQRHGLHKQIANRLLEPWMWITVIVTATEWENFFHLRCHPDAQPEIRHVADMMRKLYDTHEPLLLKSGEWHRPLVDMADVTQASTWVNETAGDDVIDDDLFARVVEDRLNQISVGRCARVSYLTHDGKRDHEADIELHDRLAKSGHWSPFEHVATPMKIDTVGCYPNPDAVGGCGNDARCPHNGPHLSGNFTGWIQYRKKFATEHAGRERRVP